MDDNYKNLEIYKYFKESKLHSSKGNTFFPVYEELFSKYRGKKITFVEIGVKWGGSLFMWKSYFGPSAKIIGIDFDPETKKLEKYGFEIFIGDQSSKKFWDDFFSKVGNIDILLDDGGHTNENQILTLNNTVEYINDNGIVLIEDSLSSYNKKFFNPSKYSFINYSKFLVDDINSRVKKIYKYTGLQKKNSLKDKIYSIKYFTNFVVFFIDRSKCVDLVHQMNRDLSVNYEKIIKDDYLNPRWNSEIYKNHFLNFFKKIKANLPIIKIFLRFLRLNVIFSKINKFFTIIKINKKLKKFFK